MKDKYEKIFIVKIWANKIEEESTKSEVDFTFVDFVQINDELFVHIDFMVIVLEIGIFLRWLFIKDTLIKLFRLLEKISLIKMSMSVVVLSKELIFF